MTESICNCGDGECTPCCTFLAKALGQVLKEGATLSVKINKEERQNFDLSNNVEKADYKDRLDAIQALQLVLVDLAASFLSCDGVNSKCCEGFATGVKDSLLGALELTIYNAYQKVIPVGSRTDELPDEYNPITNPVPIDEMTVWTNIYIAIGAAQKLVETQQIIAGAIC